MEVCSLQHAVFHPTTVVVWLRCAAPIGQMLEGFDPLVNTLGDPLLSHASEVEQDYPPNLSISVSGGKETN